jgi:uncharacterized Ntn-hydrolase superfamily protein
MDRHARVPGTDIYYAVQGNILASEAVVTDAMEAFAKAQGELTDRVMAAMEAADARGGDKRCTCDTPPKVDAPCDSKTAHVAYILLAKPTDPTGASRDDVVYSMYIRVTNPVKTLRIRYDRWRRGVS